MVLMTRFPLMVTDTGLNSALSLASSRKTTVNGIQATMNPTVNNRADLRPFQLLTWPLLLILVLCLTFSSIPLESPVLELDELEVAMRLACFLAIIAM